MDSLTDGTLHGRRRLAAKQVSKALSPALRLPGPKGYGRVSPSALRRHYSISYPLIPLRQCHKSSQCSSRSEAFLPCWGTVLSPKRHAGLCARRGPASIDAQQHCHHDFVRCLRCTRVKHHGRWQPSRSRPKRAKPHSRDSGRFRTYWLNSTSS